MSRDTAESRVFDPGPAFAPRPVTVRPLVEHAGWRLKRYDIRYEPGAVDERQVEDGLRLGLRRLPSPAVAARRPGVGFVICHEGPEALYIVLCWWDNRNELITRTSIRPNAAPGAWRDAADEYSFCVWDLEVMWREREAYVRHVLSGRGDVEAYLRSAAGSG